ncbi:MAG: hypothetical protein P8Y26_13900 [Gemmatimonadales bacterium]
MIRVVLPPHLRALARVEGDLELRVEAPVTLHSVIDAIEALHPPLRGTIRDRVTQERRPLLRFFACQEDLTHKPQGRAAARCRDVRDGTALYRGGHRRRVGRATPVRLLHGWPRQDTSAEEADLLGNR